jgi:hypothetical protein
MILANLFDEAACMKRIEEPETHSLIEPGPSCDITQSQNFVVGFKRVYDLNRVD